MATQTRTFTHLSDTKGTWRYQELVEDKPVLMGVIYVKKGTFERRPDTLEVTLKELP